MKIYNKRKFFFSLFWLAIGISIVILALIQGDLKFNDIFTAGCCGILGINGLGRSLSQRMSQEDKVEELDERNQLIELKSKRKAFQLMQCVLFFAGFLFAVLGGVYKNMTLGAAGITGAAMWVFSLMLDWLTYAYYEMKN